MESARPGWSQPQPAPVCRAGQCVAGPGLAIRPQAPRLREAGGKRKMHNFNRGRTRRVEGSRAAGSSQRRAFPATAMTLGLVFLLRAVWLESCHSQLSRLNFQNKKSPE